MRSEAPRLQVYRLFQFEEMTYLVTSWLDQRSLGRLALADAARLALAADPETWRGRALQLKSKAIRNSSQLEKVLTASAGRWAFVRSLVFPKCDLSTAAIRTLRTALPALRCVDLRFCTRAGCLRLLKELPGLEQALLAGTFPFKAPLPELKTLEFCSSASVELHQEGLEDWRKLPLLTPKLEVLCAPWFEDVECSSQAWWEKLHEPPFDCKTNDECLHALAKLNQLKEVDLSDVYTLTDAGLRTLGSLPKLERLLLRNMGPCVTAKGLRLLADGCAPLRFLDLSRCLDIGCRPNAGRTTLLQADIDAFRRRCPLTEVLFS